MVCQQPCQGGRQQDLARVLEAGDEQGVGRQVVADHLQSLPGRWPALAAAAEDPFGRQRGCAQLAARLLLSQGPLAPVAQQGLVVTGLAAEQTEPQPVGPTAEDRTCFGEQPL
ncbi:hypothetical protein D3C72_1828540 [compost metagenome]